MPRLHNSSASHPLAGVCHTNGSPVQHRPKTYIIDAGERSDIVDPSKAAISMIMSTTYSGRA